MQCSLGGDRGQRHVSHLKLLQLCGDQSLSLGQRRVTPLDALMHLRHGVRGAVTAVRAALEHTTLQQISWHVDGCREQTQVETKLCTRLSRVTRWDTYLHLTDVVFLQALDHIFHHILHACLVCLCHLCSCCSLTNSSEMFNPTLVASKPDGTTEVHRLCSRQSSTLFTSQFNNN